MHRHTAFAARILASALLFTTRLHAQTNNGPLGLFTAESDIGSPAHAGTVEYNPTRGTYTISGGGSNMWFSSDAFHFVWKKMTGDFTLAADISFDGTNGDPHRKACLVIRQSLDANSAYADAALHGSGLTALQYRETSGALTREIQSLVSAPTRLRLEKHGRNISMSIATNGGDLYPAGGAYQLALDTPFYVGLGVCAHNNKDIRTAIFSNVVLTAEAPHSGKPGLISTLEFIPIASRDRTAVYCSTNRIEAVNWSHDGSNFVFGTGGHLARLPITGGEPTLINTGFATHCENDHGFSPDGSQLAISDDSQHNSSLVYLMPAEGGAPKQITPAGPSYWHGWSPDGKTLAYSSMRNNNLDVYTMPVEGGAEKRLTTSLALDDSPEFSPDGQFIYFTSDRSGSMQIWRMLPEGSVQEQITSDEFNNWFPHVSPNGRWLVFLSYAKDVKSHLENKDVQLRMMPAIGGKIDVLAKFVGGQGSLNVPSWSPDSTKVAFVSYQVTQ